MGLVLMPRLNGGLVQPLWLQPQERRERGEQQWL